MVSVRMIFRRFHLGFSLLFYIFEEFFLNETIIPPALVGIREVSFNMTMGGGRGGEDIETRSLKF